MKNKTDIKTIDPEFGVDSRFASNLEKEADSVALMQARLDRLKNLSKEQIIHAKLIQLKLKMEDYLSKTSYDDRNYFAEFLTNYIEILYTKHLDFAKDLNISSNYLSKIINGYREPKEEFILKIMLHSGKIFENIASFQKRIWYQIYFHEKICNTMAKQDSWRPLIEKQIKISTLKIN